MYKLGAISLILFVLLSTSVFGIAPVNRDVNGTEGPVILRTNVYFRQIDYICTKKQEWKIQMTFRHHWNDPRLKFDNKNGRINYVNLEDSGRVWIPDTFISNSKSTQLHIDLKPNTLVRIYPNGNVLFSTRLTSILSCPMDLRYYPFDRQVCSVQFASYSFTTDDIILLWKEGDPVQVTKTLFIPDFTLEKYLTDYCNARTNTGEYSCLKVDFQFKRESSKYISEWLLPTAILTFLSFASFWLKPRKSTRVKFLLITVALLYLHMIYINKMGTSVSYATAKDCWLSTCLLFVLSAFVEYGIVTIIDKFNKQNLKDSKRHQNGKADPEGDAVVLKPLVEEVKDNHTESSNQCKLNEVPSHLNLIEKWRQAQTTSRIDILSAFLFPLFFMIYIITFLCYQTHRQ